MYWTVQRVEVPGWLYGTAPWIMSVGGLLLVTVAGSWPALIGGVGIIFGVRTLTLRFKR